ncbi:MAG: Glu/Leu/Phe/Val dehydrogenase [Pseudomonadota bacterium]
MFDHSDYDSHEGVHLFEDPDSGLRAIIAIHSTRRGPGAGGCRMWNYPDGRAMLSDALRLSQGMSYKNAMADLPLGGGKAVIWGDPKSQKSGALFRAFGRAVDSLNGRYWTAEDVGVSPSDMAYAAQETRFVAGLESGPAASGDPSPVTAEGVFRGIEVCAKRALEVDSLVGVTVAVQGVGHVGGKVCRLLHQAGANLIITDVHRASLEAVAQDTGARIVEPEDIYGVQADLFSPNALGGVINSSTLEELKVKVIAGGANNQLSSADMGERLRDAGILYAPDYVINGGGIINVAAEISGDYSREWVAQKLDALVATLEEVLDAAAATGDPTNSVADRIARARIGRDT